MLKYLFRNTENELFNKIRKINQEALWIWNITNLGFPIFTLLMTFIVLSYSDKGKDVNRYIEVALGGTLPLVAINIIVAASFFLIKFNSQKELDYGLKTTNTRLKLILFCLFSYLFSSCLFVIQTIYSPFKSILAVFSQIGYSLFALVLALAISNRLFLLQEEMIETSYDQSIANGVSKLKSAIK